MIRRRDLWLPDGQYEVRAEGGIRGRGASRGSVLGALCGAMRTWEPFGGEPLASVPDGEGAIEMGVEVNAQPGVAAAAWAGRELDEAPV